MFKQFKLQRSARVVLGQRPELSLAQQLLHQSEALSSMEMAAHLTNLGISCSGTQRYPLNADVLLVRHACSEYNYCIRSIQKDARRSILLDSSLVDPALHPAGLMQVRHQAKGFAALDLDTVLISPLKRTLQTAFHLFKAHPKRHSMRFVVMPQLCEVMGHISDFQVADIGPTHQRLFRQYGMQLQLEHLVAAMRQSVIPEFWQLSVAANETRKAQFVEAYDKMVGTDLYRLHQKKKDMLKWVFEQSEEECILENEADIQVRVKQAKQSIAELLSQMGSKRAAIISHHHFIRALSGDSYHLKNVEAAPLSWEQLLS